MGCAYPLDDNMGPDMKCCGAPVRDIGGVYCDYHCSICFGRELAPLKVEEAA